MNKKLFAFLAVFMVASIVLTACGGKKTASEDGKKTVSGNVMEPQQTFNKSFLLKDFLGTEMPPCGHEPFRVVKEKRAIALLNLGMIGLSLAEYRRCYKTEFLK